MKKALEIWSVQSLCDMGILLSICSFVLHIGRPYFERILSRFTLRVAADLWWMLYVLARDGTLLIAVLLGIWHLNLDLMADIKVGLPFVPAGTVVLAAALLTKVFRNAEDINRAYRTTTWLVSAGALLNLIGWVFVMEGPGDEYSIAQSAFWQTMDSWRSNKNPEMTTVVFHVALAALVVMGVWTTVKAMRLLAKEQSKDG